MNKYWDNFYKSHKFKKESSFARFCKPYILSEMVELGSGEGRDLRYFEKFIEVNGVDKAFNCDVKDWIKKHKSPEYVYTRFFWHSIDRKLQLKILDWVKNYIFIEARTTQDKPKDLFGKHKRNLVDVGQLIEDLVERDFKIIRFKQGKGLSKFKGEDPHLIRCIAIKSHK